MKARYSLRLLPLLVISCNFSAVAFSGIASAATNQYWNVADGGGDGNWSTNPGDKNWNTTAGAPLAGNTFWSDPTDDVAVFQNTTAGIVTVIDTVQTSGIIQNGANYTINAGSITLVQDAALVQPSIAVQSGTLTIDSTLDGTHGLIKTGSGNLLLSSTHTYTGTTAIVAGTLTLAGDLISTTVDISTGAGLQDLSGGFAPTTVLTNAGTLTLGANDTITTYISNGGTLGAGPGTLTTTTATLNHGSSVAGLLGADTLTSNGAVGISGTATANSTRITGGTLTLTGSLISATVENDPGAVLSDLSGGLAPGTVLTNAGTLTLGADDTITTYISNGGTLGAGPGTLTTTTATLNHGSSVAGLLGATTLTSNGAVAISGTATANSTRITGDTLTLTGSLISATVEIDPGAVLSDLSGGLAPGTVLTNAGTLTLGADDTITTYISNGGTLAAGPGTLTTTTATLNHGSSVAGLLGATTLTSNGAVAISGTATANSTRITGGTLTLTGSLISATVEIDPGAALSDLSGGLAPGTVLTNAGTLTLGADDTITTYISNGGTLGAGPGTLTTTTANLNHGSSVAGLLGADSLTSNGAVAISGTATANSTRITGGTLTLTGSLVSATVEIDPGAVLSDLSGGLAPGTVLTNAGTLTLGADDTITTYISNGGTLGAGPGTLTTTTATLNHGSSVAGLLGADSLTSNGAVAISGTATANSTRITGGTLTLTGSLVSATVEIDPGAVLSDLSGGLAPGTVLTNAGTLTLGADDTITTYISNGGTLGAGPGTLTTTTATLNHGSSVAGQLVADSLTSNGTVTISGTATVDTANIASGILTNTGTLGTITTRLNITAGATLVASGTQHYEWLTTSGSGPGIWQGNLVNPATIAPGGAGAIGTLLVSGNFTNLSGVPGGVLNLDIARDSHDLLAVTGVATLGGTLELNQLGADPLAPFVPINVVAAGTYAGNFSRLNENLDGVVWFNPANGDITRIPIPHGSRLFGSTANQTSTWIALYDDVIDPGFTNITRTGGFLSGYDITSGIADGTNPDLLWALTATFTPAGLATALLNRLSPEVYAAFQDYAIQATRTHQRSAFSAPALALLPKPVGNTDSKGGTKDAFPATPSGPQWELFAATDYFNVATTHSQNQADYDLSGFGIMAGARTMVTDRVQLAAYLAGDDGDVNGSLIDADSNGWSIGLLGEILLDAHSRTHLTLGISYGRYTFDGSRHSASATESGWSPGQVDFDNVDSDALELFIGMEGVIYQNDRFRLIPSLGLRYATGSMDSFTESTGNNPGAPIALAVDQNHYDSTLAEIGLLAEADLTRNLTLWGQLGASAGIGDAPHDISAHFAKGSRTMHTETEGLSNDLWFIGLGASYKINASVSVGLGYRTEFRADADNQNSVNLSSTFRF